MEENENEVNQTVAAENVTETSAPVDAAVEKTEDSKPKSKKPAIFGAIAAVVVLAGGAVGAFFGLDMNVPSATEWVKDYSAVQISAGDRDKSILLAFTGVDWDNVSGKFEKEIMQDSEFIKKMGKKYELAQIDIPGGEAEVSEEEMQSIFTYAMMYGLQTTPSLILVDSKGASYGIVAYSEDMGLEAVIEAVENAETAFKDLKKLKDSIDKAQGVKKVKLIDELYEKSSDEERVELMDYILEVPALDPKNESGLLGKYKLLGGYNEASIYMQKGDVKSARDVLVRVAEDPALEPELAQESFYTAAYISAIGGLITSQEEIDSVVALIQKAIDVNPESEHIADLQQFMDLVKAQPIDDSAE